MGVSGFWSNAVLAFEKGSVKLQKCQKDIWWRKVLQIIYPNWVPRKGSSKADKPVLKARYICLRLKKVFVMSPLCENVLIE